MWDSKDQNKTKETTTAQEKSMESGGVDDKCDYDSSRVDSGFISGQNLSCEIVSEEIRSPQDSGLVDDEPSSKNQSELMRLDSGVDVGLTESFSNLNIKNVELNNLNPKSSKSKRNIIEKQYTKVEDQSPPWALYYQQDEEGETQLHIAIIHGLYDVVCCLIRMAPHPCVLNIKNDNADAPLHLAVLTGQPQIVRRLLVAGAEADIQNRHGNTPLHLACISGDMNCVRALTAPITTAELNAAGAEVRRCQPLPQDLERKNYDGEVCVHLAAQGNHIDILRHLMWYGANINAREGKTGRTPLHFAIEENKPDLAQFLLNECPSLLIEASTYAGKTAYQLTHNEELLAGLLQKGAIPMEPDSDSDYSDSEDSDTQFGNLNFYSPSFKANSAINVA